MSAPSASHPAHHAPAVWFLKGVRAGLSVPAIVLFASYLGFGAVLQSVGFPLGAGLASTLLVWALPAQLILIGGIAAGTALPALALAVALSSMRLLPMVVSVAPYLRGPRRSLFWELVCAHYVAMTVWLESLRLLPHLPGEARLPFTLGLGNMLIAVSMCGTVAGFLVAGELPTPLAAGLLLLTPLSFTVLMVRNAVVPTDWLALAAGFLLMPATLGLDGGLDLMIAGIGGGSFAYLAGRLLERRRRGRP
ncbi:AzlC family ABC transporter permease [Xanthobacter autotrophicus]|uniref:AzlC family ABC transporter permease n=1 Tax=Xanthobacter TaxID=279 RepID=UPI0024AC7B08|nr:AzlC family ABC transporter permease [Xanthobacter autotrophicus]MDI4663629.1 AzlC family ABC transporter permease [Xanthobacter autotrophicus]